MPIPISSSSQAGHIVPKVYVSSDFTNIHSLHTPYRLVPIQMIVNFTLEYVMKPKETGRLCLTIWSEDEAGDDGGGVVLCVGTTLAPWFC